MKTMSKDYFESISVSTWKLSTLMSILLMTKIPRNTGMWQPFHNKSDVIVTSEKQCANVQYLVTKQHNLVSKQNSIENIFDCTQWFSLQSLICTIQVSIVCFCWELEFRNYFLISWKPLFCKRLCLLRKTTLLQSRN